MHVQVLSVRGALSEPEGGLDLDVQVTTGWWRWKRVRTFAVHVRWVPYTGRQRWNGRWSITRLQSLTNAQENEFRSLLVPYLRAFAPGGFDPEEDDTIPNYKVRKRHSLGDP